MKPCFPVYHSLSFWPKSRFISKDISCEAYNPRWRQEGVRRKAFGAPYNNLEVMAQLQLLITPRISRMISYSYTEVTQLIHVNIYVRIISFSKSRSVGEGECWRGLFAKQRRYNIICNKDKSQRYGWRFSTDEEGSWRVGQMMNGHED